MTASKKKSEANRQNAKLSTGPRDTTATRFNALKHGILSKEVLLTMADDVETFDRFSNALREDLAPVGAKEEFIMEDLIAIAWRMRRVLTYESAVIDRNCEKALKDCVLRNPTFCSLVLSIPKPVRGIFKGVSMMSDPAVQCIVIGVASKLGVPVHDILGPDQKESYPAELIWQLVDAAVELCGSQDVFSEDFVTAAIGEWTILHSEWNQLFSEMHREIKLASLPDEASLGKIQRYDTNLSRQFDKKLDQLQRLQAARRGT